MFSFWSCTSLLVGPLLGEHHSPLETFANNPILCITLNFFPYAAGLVGMVRALLDIQKQGFSSLHGNPPPPCPRAPFSKGTPCLGNTFFSPRRPLNQVEVYRSIKFHKATGWTANFFYFLVLHISFSGGRTIPRLNPAATPPLWGWVTGFFFLQK